MVNPMKLTGRHIKRNTKKNIQPSALVLLKTVGGY